MTMDELLDESTTGNTSSLRRLNKGLSFVSDVSNDSVRGLDDHHGDDGKHLRKRQSNASSRKSGPNSSNTAPKNPVFQIGPEDALPEALVEDILNGKVVAFIGSGFSRACALPTWQELLQAVAADMFQEGCLTKEEVEAVKRLGSSNSSHDLDLAAQILADTANRTNTSKFESRVREKLTVGDLTKLPQAMQDRLKFVRGIPFSAILTTNFDNLLPGNVDPQHPSFGKVAATILRETKSEYHRMQAIAFGSSKTVTPVVKLHGDVLRPSSRLVCTRQSYREMLHSSNQYSTFLRTLLATKTLLFIGFSFTDAYFNEIRAEVISLYGGKWSKPLSYAILPDCSAVQAKALYEQEAMVVLGFDTENQTNFRGVDRFLERLYETTNPVIKFGKLLHEKNVLWLHTNWQASRGTKFLKDFLCKANKSIFGELTTKMCVVASADEALKELKQCQYDCVICCYDGTTNESTQANTADPPGTETIKFLSNFRRDVSIPHVNSLVFGYDVETKQRRAKVLSLGARAYTSVFYELLSELAYILQNTNRD